MVATRRMGSIDSEKGEAMLAAAADILREEGYAALTSRRVADYMGVKQRLVYYYFSTMEELVLECFKRLSRMELARLERANASEHPLKEIWDVCYNTVDARLVSEFMAIANRNEPMREEVIYFIRESRRLQVEMITSAISRLNEKYTALAPELIAFLGTSIALALNRESSLGIEDGHAEVFKLIEHFFASVKP